MTGSFTGRAVVEMVQKYAGSHPVEVEVMNDCDVIIQLEPTVSVGEAARLLHGTHDWFGQVALNQLFAFHLGKYRAYSS